MRSDLQGMSVVIEHVVRALGGTKPQLYEMFRELWTDPAVAKALRGATTLARQSRPPSDWPAIKFEIESLAQSGPAGRIASDSSCHTAFAVRGIRRYMKKISLSSNVYLSG